LDREEAIIALKKILATHMHEPISYIELVPQSQSNNTLSIGYQLHIKGATFHPVKDLEHRVKKYGLAVTQENECVIIYKPKRALEKAKLP
jgi:hypothetical protein